MQQDRFYDIAITSEIARNFGVDPHVHLADFVFLYHMDGKDKRPLEDALRVYFEDGRQSAARLTELVREFLPQRPKPRLLEFASGYGCLTRYFVNDPTFFQTTACDIHAEAVDFIRDALGTRAVLSNREPGKLDLGGEQFDVVFALSFFSHIPPTTFAHWLNRLLDAVADGGLLIFTTHGRSGQAAINLQTLGPDGYCFNPISEQKDLPTNEYGTMVVTPYYVLDAISGRSDFALKLYRESFWWGFQDIFILERIVEGHACGIWPMTSYLQRERLRQALEGTLAEAAAVTKDYEKFRRDSEHAIQTFRNSTSWKITSPLRLISHAFTKIVRNKTSN